MIRASLVLACAAMLAACSSPDRPAAPAAAPAMAIGSAVVPAPPATPPQPTALARYDGYGDLRFGMDETAFEQAWGGELKGASEPGANCFHKSPKWQKLPSDFSFMFEGGRFARYDVGTTKEAAPDGGEVGMSEAQIRQLYGDRVVAQPHKYVAGAKYLRIAAVQGNGVLLFETDEHGRVTRWRAGVPPQVDYVEGCS